MLVRPLSVVDAPALHAFLTHPEVAAVAGTTPFDPLALTLARISPPGGGEVHRFGAFGGESLRGFVTLSPLRYGRARHVGSVELVTTPGAGAGLLVAAAELASRWIGFLRLQCEVSANDAPGRAALEEASFSLEFRRVGDRLERGVLADTLGFARFDPDWIRRPVAALPPPWPPQSDAPSSLRIRPATAADAEGWTENMRLPEVRWGTLQLPSITPELWRTRLDRTDRSAGFALVAEVDGTIVGTAGVHPRPFPSAHVGGIGMSVGGAWQGRRIGSALLSATLDAAAWLGFRRVELEVYPDNHRAVALYRRHGFVEEGVRMAAVRRDGDLVDSVVMGLTL